LRRKIIWEREGSAETEFGVQGPLDITCCESGGLKRERTFRGIRKKEEK